MKITIRPEDVDNLTAELNDDSFVKAGWSIDVFMRSVRVHFDDIPTAKKFAEAILAATPGDTK